jgi:hypothetical protein
MALINCPECNSRVSDQAASCPKCGYPLRQEQQGKSFAELLVNSQWEARSAGLAAQSLQATFASDGTFEGILNNPPGDMIISPQQVSGQWHVAAPILALTYNYVDNMSGPARAEFEIEITEVSESRLSGIDKWVRLWEFQKLS